MIRPWKLASAISVEPLLVLAAVLGLDPRLGEHRPQLFKIAPGDRDMIDLQIRPHRRHSENQREQFHIFVLITSINSCTAAVLLASIAFSSSFSLIS